MEDCLFCKIIRKEIPAEIVFDSDSVLAFRDINAQAPTHILVIPKKHVEGIHAAGSSDDLQGLLLAAVQTARDEGIETAGYRLVINSGRHGGQTVDHLHVHILGGRTMTWPPG
jgi:histidine triad (HIT) family protein